MGWPLWSTLVPRLLDLLRYQPHNGWNTPEWESIIHSLHHLATFIVDWRLAVRSTCPSGVCQHWLRRTSIGWGSTFSFSPSSFVYCLYQFLIYCPLVDIKSRLHLSLGHFLHLDSSVPLLLILQNLTFDSSSRTLFPFCGPFLWAGFLFSYILPAGYNVLRLCTGAPTSTHSWHPYIAQPLITAWAQIQ